jgi:hypothetical protein
VGETLTVMLLACRIFFLVLPALAGSVGAVPSKTEAVSGTEGVRRKGLRRTEEVFVRKAAFSERGRRPDSGLFKGCKSQGAEKRSRQGTGEFWSICRGLLWAVAFSSRFAPCEFGRVRWGS